MIPDYTLHVDNEPLHLGHHLLRLTLRDMAGLEADQLDIEIDDSQGAIAFPRRGAVLKLAIGFKGEPLVEKGLYTVDELTHQGPPDRITLRARSADWRGGLKAQKERGWHDTTLGALVESIAAEHGLTPTVDAKLAAIPVGHFDQTRESDAHLLTRMARDHDAVATTKSGWLIFTQAATGESTGGTQLTPITITRAVGDGHNYGESDRVGEHTGVKSQWRDKEAAKDHQVVAGAPGTLKGLRKSYADERSARQAAEAEWRRLRRGDRKLSLKLAVGRPEILTESPVTCSGFKPEIDRQPWIAMEVTHTLDSGGLTTALSLTPPADKPPLEG